MKKVLFVLPLVLLVAAALNLGKAPSLPGRGGLATPVGSVAIFPNGSATATVQGSAPIVFPAGTVNVATLTSLLAKVPDLTKLAGGSCNKSSSFGTTTSLTYNGKSTGDLSCTSGTAWTQAGYDLAKFVMQVELTLNVSTGHQVF